MKKLINDPQEVMRESLAGFAAAHSDILKVSFDPVYVVRADAPVTGKVGIISGGGSGHEPLHGGFVGQGMLDAACPGQVFTSPSPDQMEAATSAVDGGAGVLHIVKNYTGDVMNFEMAAELCQARGIQVQAVVINDDVAVQDSLYTAGRRGVGATVLAEKICGAAAARGYDLGRVAALGRRVNDSARSMGMALSLLHRARRRQTEVRVGRRRNRDGRRHSWRTGPRAHASCPPPNRSRTWRGHPRRSADSAPATASLPWSAAWAGRPCSSCISSTANWSSTCAAGKSRSPRRLVGNYITSLDMAGCSITLLQADDELLSLWDDPVLTPALRWGI